MFSGQIRDAAKSLKAYSDANSAARERAVGEAKKEGAEVDLDTYKFDNWRPRTNYTSEMYQK